MALGKTTLARLAAAAVLAAVGCTGSEPAEGVGGSPGQSGNGGSSGASAGGNGSTETGGSNATGGSGASAGDAATGGTSATGGQVGTGGSNNGGGGGSAGSGGGSAGSGGGSATSGGGSAASGGGSAASGGGNTGATGGQAGTGGSNNGGGGGNAGSGGAAGTGGGSGGAAPAACSPARPHARGNSTVNLQSSGKNRSYLLHIPPGYDGTKPLPLVFDVHGYTSFASEQLMRSKWDQMADKEGFVLIDPDGVNKSWNAGSCCGGNSENDVQFFRDMVAKATAELCIDSKRVYVSGHSNGGAMTYRLGCEAADIFAAIAPVCGWMTINNCSPARPVPVLAIRGLNDSTVTNQYRRRRHQRVALERPVLENSGHDERRLQDLHSLRGRNAGHGLSSARQSQFLLQRGNGNPDQYLVPDNAWPFFKQFSLP